MDRLPRRSPTHLALTAALTLIAAAATAVPAASAGIEFAVSFPASRSAAPLDGRLLLLLSTNGEAEPRFQISDGPATQLVFGVDVDGLKPGAEAVIDASAFGYPVRSLAELPAGEYYVQALLHRYETFHRSDGHTVRLPMDRGEGQRWNAAPGNLISAPRRMSLDPRRDGTVRIVLDQEIPPIPPPKDTKYIRHERIQSERLTKFWGRPMYLGRLPAPARGIRRASRGPLSPGHLPRPFPLHLRRLPGDAARSEPQARL